MVASSSAGQFIRSLVSGLGFQPGGTRRASVHSRGVTRILPSCYRVDNVHIPDGFLATPVWAALDLTAAPSVAYMARRAQGEFDESKVPLLGVLGAFVFAAQLINFPVGPGTTAHLVGGALLSFTLGPAAASVVMTAILAIQALVFQDGGILALGANTVNMAVLGVLAGYLPFALWGGGRFAKLAIFAGAALSVWLARWRPFPNCCSPA